MSQLIDLIGQKYGNLTVLERAPNRGQHVYWKCQCDCGDIKEIRSQHLREGKIKTCTHCNSNAIINQVFGNWKVIKQTEYKKGDSLLYECECIYCGAKKLKTSTEIKQNHQFCNNCRSIDISNNKYGHLTAIKRLGSDQYRHSIWECKCDCGNIVNVSYGHLVSGDTKSCGCTKSFGEAKIRKILQENNIIFETQKTFETCKFPETNTLARFDFYLPEYNTIIEYDGSQHFYYTNSGWNTKENFIAIKQRDNYKDQWCKKNNIKLIRIPYIDYDKINIEYIKEII